MSNQTAVRDYAIDRVIRMEGGLVDHPSDPGGVTNFGISLRYALRGPSELLDVNRDGRVDRRDIRALTHADAAKIYRADWWNAMRLDELPPRVAVQMLDCAVNMGRKRAAILLQRACRWHGIELVDDGIIGPKTRAAVWEICTRGDDLVPALKAEQGGFYRSLADRRPSMRVFLKGWLARAAEPVDVPAN